MTLYFDQNHSGKKTLKHGYKSKRLTHSYPVRNWYGYASGMSKYLPDIYFFNFGICLHLMEFGNVLKKHIQKMRPSWELKRVLLLSIHY